MDEGNESGSTAVGDYAGELHLQDGKHNGQDGDHRRHRVGDHLLHIRRHRPAHVGYTPNLYGSADD